MKLTVAAPVELDDFQLVAVSGSWKLGNRLWPTMSAGEIVSVFGKVKYVSAVRATAIATKMRVRLISVISYRAPR